MVPALEPCQPDMSKYEDQPPGSIPRECLPPSLADSAGVGPASALLGVKEGKPDYRGTGLSW